MVHLTEKQADQLMSDFASILEEFKTGDDDGSSLEDTLALIAEITEASIRQYQFLDE